MYSDKGYDCSFSGSVLYADIPNCIYSSYISNTSTYVYAFGAAGNWYQSSLSVLHTDNEKVARTELRLPSLYSSTADVSTGDFCNISLPVNMYDSQLNLAGGYSSGSEGTGNIVGCVVDIVKTGDPTSLFWVSCNTIQSTDITAVGSVLNLMHYVSHIKNVAIRMQQKNQLEVQNRSSVDVVASVPDDFSAQDVDIQLEFTDFPS